MFVSQQLRKLDLNTDEINSLLLSYWQRVEWCNKKQTKVLYRRHKTKAEQLVCKSASTQLASPRAAV